MAKGKKTPATGAQTPATPKGAQTPAVAEPQVPKGPAVVGINFGNTYASIAVITKEGLAECIANEDGERQIACAVSFHGEQTYIGNGATQQLVKNSENTIIGFRNLLGKKFSEISHPSPSIPSCPLIQHPSQPDTPAYRVHTGASSDVEKILSVSEITTLFLKSLLASASAVMGRPSTGAVISVPSSFTPAQKVALKAATEAAGTPVIQLLDEVAAIGVEDAAGQPAADRTALVVDLGQTALNLTLLSVRHGLVHALAEHTTTDVKGSHIDNALLKFFSKDFVKRTKVPLTLPLAPGSTDKGDLRAEARLRLALEHTKRTIAASPGAAACAVESLKDGMDYAGTINRMRFDMEARSVYTAVCKQAQELLDKAGVDAHLLDELVFVGGAGCLPGLQEAVAGICSEDVKVGSSTVDPTEIISVGCALQADLLARLQSGDDKDAALLLKAFQEPEEAEEDVLARTIGVLFPSSGEDEAGLGGLWVPVVLAETALPCRRTVSVETAGGAVGFEIWEASERIKITKEKPPPLEDEEEDEEEEEIETKHRETVKETLLGGLKLETSAKGRVRVQIVVGTDGKVKVSAWEEGKEGAKSMLTID